MRIHCREHDEGSKPRMRVWTERMADYGQFNIVEHSVLANAIPMLSQLGIHTVLHYCDCSDECKCKIVKEL